MSRNPQERISERRLGVAGTVIAVLVLWPVTAPALQAQTFTVLYTFIGEYDGAYPVSGVIQDQDGNLYGTASARGGYNDGAVFEVTTSGTETALYRFVGGPTDGERPVAGLLRDSEGTLYGTTPQGGKYGYGVVFKVDTAGNEAVLHDFAGGTTDGCSPYQGLVEDKSGSLYGTTSECGAFGKGTVFKLTKAGKTKCCTALLEPTAQCPTTGVCS